VLPLDINRNTILDACEDCDGDGTTDADALAGAHNCWIASEDSDVVGEYHADSGVLVQNAAAGQLGNPQDVAITRSGRIFVSSALDDRVVEFDRSGAYVGDLVGPGAGGLDYPTGLLLTPGGTLLVSSRNSHRVIEYALDTGAYLGDFVGAASGGLNAPFGLALGPNGNLFVTGFDNQVREYDGQTGAFVGIFVTSADNGGLSNPRGLTFKPDGHLLVAGFSSNAVLEFDGTTGAYLRASHHGGTIYGPWGVRVGPNGNVFLTRDYVPTRDAGGGPEPLHATTTRIYEYDPISGYHLRSYILGDDTGLSSPTGFAFMPGAATDCNANYIPDNCDIASGTSLDLDGDGTPDECGACCRATGCEQLNRTTCESLVIGSYLGDQTRCQPACTACGPGDWDCDGDVDLDDHLVFYDCLNGPDTAPAPSLTSTQACLDAFDFDFDGDVDLADYDPFMAAAGQL
ncbi:MAG: hypothetical protein GY778_12260, partial [bacterium]|nr:hypothetical protein [bacterium]